MSRRLTRPDSSGSGSWTRNARLHCGHRIVRYPAVADENPCLHAGQVTRIRSEVPTQSSGLELPPVAVKAGGIVGLVVIPLVRRPAGGLDRLEPQRTLALLQSGRVASRADRPRPYRALIAGYVEGHQDEPIRSGSSPHADIEECQRAQHGLGGRSGNRGEIHQVPHVLDDQFGQVPLYGFAGGVGGLAGVDDFGRCDGLGGLVAGDAGSAHRGLPFRLSGWVI
jgi:hypothetical protein